MKKIILFSFATLLLNCNKAESPKPEQSQNPLKIDSKSNDSIALLALTKKLYQWNETESKGQDFDVLLKNENDSVYSEIDKTAHQKRLEELRKTNLFTEDFINSYNKIALKIDEKMKSGALVYKVGELPPFGNDANPWCNCQDRPDDFLDKIWIMNLKNEGKSVSYNWSWGDGMVYNLKAVKENNQWKINAMEGFDYDSFVKSLQYSNDFTGNWENGLVILHISEDQLNLEYHGQCMYSYPIRKINSNEFEMIWAREMDCKFDNGTDKTFGLKKVPEIGKPFAKYKLENNRLSAEYYYKDWVKKYSQEVQEEVFTPEYSRKIESY